MGVKRSLHDMDHDMDSQNEHDDAEEARDQSAKRANFHGKTKHNAKEGTSEYAKKRVRNIKRLMARQQDLPADVRNEMERELAALETDIAHRLYHKKRNAMISRYHKVRFFERQKASRLVKQLRHQLETNKDPEDVPRLKQELHVAQVDEAYSRYHPHMEPYISMYSNVKTDEQTGKVSVAKLALTKAEKPPLWKVVEEAMEQGPEALVRLRERRIESDRNDCQKSKRPLAKPVTNLDSSSQDILPQTQAQPRSQQLRMGQCDEAQRQSNEQQQSKTQKQSKATLCKQQPVLPENTRREKSHKANGLQPQLNRRERRKRMRETEALKQDDAGGDGGFFEEI